MTIKKILMQFRHVKNYLEPFKFSVFKLFSMKYNSKFFQLSMRRENMQNENPSLSFCLSFYLPFSFSYTYYIPTLHSSSTKSHASQYITGLDTPCFLANIYKKFQFYLH